VNQANPIQKCIDCLGTAAENDVVWNCIPVPSFGNPRGEKVKVVTIGLNPALTETRLPTLSYYRKKSRNDLSELDVADAQKWCDAYFIAAPHRYFEPLDCLLGRVNYRWSYFTGSAVHCDLVACATKSRFNKTESGARKALIGNCRTHLLRTLGGVPSSASLLLNGKTICEELPRWGSVKYDKSAELLFIDPPLAGIRGSIQIQGRSFLFRGWNIPVGKLNPAQRFDLANWLRQHCNE
jgi:hypothetical protein